MAQPAHLGWLDRITNVQWNNSKAYTYIFDATTIGPFPPLGDDSLRIYVQHASGGQVNVPNVKGIGGPDGNPVENWFPDGERHWLFTMSDVIAAQVTGGPLEVSFFNTV